MVPTSSSTPGLENQSLQYSKLTQCPVCNQPIQIAWNFCPNCGHTLREKPLSTSIGKQIGIYLLSFFLPPFGLSPAFKYLKQKNPGAKMVGLVAIILTTASLVVMIFAFKAFMDYYAKVLNSISHPY